MRKTRNVHRIFLKALPDRLRSGIEIIMKAYLRQIVRMGDGLNWPNFMTNDKVYYHHILLPQI